MQHRAALELASDRAQYHSMGTSISTVRRILTTATLVLNVGACAHGNHVAMIAGAAALACDWSQTREAARRDWIERTPTENGFRSNVYSERNPILGSTPSTGTVDAYFAIALGLTALAWHFVPDRYRWTVPAGVLAIQATAIASNTMGSAGLPLCGIGN